MPSPTQSDLLAGFHATESYFFSSLSTQEKNFDSIANAYYTGIKTDLFNLLIIQQGSTQLEAILQESKEFYEKRNSPFAVVLPSTVIHCLHTQLDTLGFNVAFETQAMHLGLVNYTVPEYTFGIFDSIEPTNKNLKDWGTPLETAFEAPEFFMQQYQTAHQRMLDNNNNIIHFSLYRESLPVSSLTVSIVNNTARLDDIGTQVGFQKRGYANNLLCHTLSYLQQRGITDCFLDASAEGASLYTRLGFCPLFKCSTFCSSENIQN